MGTLFLLVKKKWIVLWVLSTDLKNRTGSSIYCWETEANGGHIGVTTWRVQWRHRKENENCDIFYLKLMDEMRWLNTN